MVTSLARFEPLLSALKPEFFTTLPWRSLPGGKGPLLSTQQLSLCSVGYQKGTVVCVCGGGCSGLKNTYKNQKGRLPIT